MRFALTAVALAATILLPAVSPAAAALPVRAAQQQAKPIRKDSPEGSWQGTLEPPGAGKLVLMFHVRSEKGKLVASLDVPQQGGKGIPVAGTEFKSGPREVAFDIAVIAAKFRGKMAADGQSIAGTFEQSGKSLPLTLRRASAAETAALAPKRPQDPKSPFPYRAEEVTFANPKAKDVKLAGTLTIPPGEGPFPTVVFISGSGPQDRDETIFGHRPFRVIADYLARRRVASLRFDDRGVGKSTGKLETATSADFADDVRAAVAYLKTRGAVTDPKKIGLIGHSEGGVIAPMVAADAPSDIAFVVLLAGTGVNGAEVVLSQGAAMARLSGAPESSIAREQQFQKRVFDAVRSESDPRKRREKVDAVIRAQTEGAGKETRQQVEAELKRAVEPILLPWFRWFLVHDPAATLAKVKCPVLALTGEKDVQVLPAVNVPPMEAALKNNPNARVEVLPGLNHLFQTAVTGMPSEYATIEETFSKDALALIGNWIAERTQ